MQPIQPSTFVPSTTAIAARSGSMANEATSSRAERMSCQAEGTCASAFTRIAAACSRCDADVAPNGMTCTIITRDVFARSGARSIQWLRLFQFGRAMFRLRAEPAGGVQPFHYHLVSHHPEVGLAPVRHPAEFG